MTDVQETEGRERQELPVAESGESLHDLAQRASMETEGAVAGVLGTAEVLRSLPLTPEEQGRGNEIQERSREILLQERERLEILVTGAGDPADNPQTPEEWGVWLERHQQLKEKRALIDTVLAPPEQQNPEAPKQFQELSESLGSLRIQKKELMERMQADVSERTEANALLIGSVEEKMQQLQAEALQLFDGPLQAMEQRMSDEWKALEEKSWLRGMVERVRGSAAAEWYGKLGEWNIYSALEKTSETDPRARQLLDRMGRGGKVVLSQLSVRNAVALGIGLGGFEVAAAAFSLPGGIGDAQKTMRQAREAPPQEEQPEEQGRKHFRALVQEWQQLVTRAMEQNMPLDTLRAQPDYRKIKDELGQELVKRSVMHLDVIEGRLDKELHGRHAAFDARYKREGVASTLGGLVMGALPAGDFVQASLFEMVDAMTKKRNP